MHYALRLEKNYQHGLDVGPLEFQFLWPRGCLTNPFRTLSLCFRLIGKTPGLISCKNLIKKIFVCIGHCNNVLARCDSILPLLRRHGVWKEKNMHTTFSFPDPLLESEELQSWGCSKILPSFLLQFDGHFDQINNSSSVYLSLSQFWMATSLVIFYQFPSVSKSRVPPKNI
jgi:hypothetical protein